MLTVGQTECEWTLIAEMFDGSTVILNPEQLFVGDMFDASCEADRLCEDLDGVEGITLESKGIPCQRTGGNNGT